MYTFVYIFLWCLLEIFSNVELLFRKRITSISFSNFYHLSTIYDGVLLKKFKFLSGRRASCVQRYILYSWGDAIFGIHKWVPTFLIAVVMRPESSPAVHILRTRIPCENWTCFTLFPLSVWQEIVFHARQTCKQQRNTLSQEKLLCHNNTNWKKVWDVD